MPLKITKHHTGEIQLRRSASSIVFLGPEDQQEVLEALALARGYGLVSQAQRAEVLRLADEVDDAENQFNSASAAWVHWQDLAESLAAAARSAVDLEA